MATFVYAFLFAWDELLFVAALTEHNAETLPLGIRLFIGNYSQYYGQLMAAGVISTIPVVIAFFAAQRWLVRGHHRGGGQGMTTIDPQVLDLGGEPDAARVPAGRPPRRGDGVVPDRGRRRRRRARRVDLGSLLRDARARWPTATPASPRATTTAAGSPTST